MKKLQATAASGSEQRTTYLVHMFFKESDRRANEGRWEWVMRMGDPKKLWKAISWNGEFSNVQSKRIAPTNAEFKEHCEKFGASKETPTEDTCMSSEFTFRCLMTISPQKKFNLAYVVSQPLLRLYFKFRTPQEALRDTRSSQDSLGRPISGSPGADPRSHSGQARQSATL